MAEFLNQQRPEPMPSGVGLMGHALEPWRRERAYEHCKAMGLDSATAFDCVNRVVAQYERDQPYEAQKIAMQYLDLTGHYRLMAALLADKE